MGRWPPLRNKLFVLYCIVLYHQVLKVSVLSIHCNALQGVESFYFILVAVRFILCIRRLL